MHSDGFADRVQRLVQASQLFIHSREKMTPTECSAPLVADEAAMEQWIPTTPAPAEAKPRPRTVGRLALLTGLVAVALPIVLFAPRPIETGALLAIAVAGVRFTGRALNRWSGLKMARTPWRRLPTGATRIGATATLCFALWTGAYVYHYSVSWSTAARGLLRDVLLSWIRAGVAIYDPCTPTLAPLGPSNTNGFDPTEYVRIEELDFPRDGGTGKVVLVDFHNERIVRSSHAFAYQPYDEPRLQEMRRKYALDAVVAGAKNDFEAMVRLRSWTRSQLRRADYQPMMFRFDTLTILDRNLRNDTGACYAKAEHIDPCLLFPQMYCQVLASLGHHGRFVNTEHGMAEVWSNHHRKWVLMDAEFDLHYEKRGVPLSLLELARELPTAGLRELRIVRGTQTSGDINPTEVHLHAPKLNLELLQGFVQLPLNVELRNDWLTNAHFRGHPKRSEDSELVYSPCTSSDSILFARRLRRLTNNVDDVYWTLNQTEVLARVPTGLGSLHLLFQTVTPNFKCFEVVLNEAAAVNVSAPHFNWRLHSGLNELKVQSVNMAGVRGPASYIRYQLVNWATSDPATNCVPSNPKKED